MQISEYLRPRGSQAELSKKLGITAGRMSQLANSNDWPPEIALKAEEETEGELDAAKLSSIIARARQQAA